MDANKLKLVEKPRLPQTDCRKGWLYLLSFEEYVKVGFSIDPFRRLDGNRYGTTFLPNGKRGSELSLQEKKRLQLIGIRYGSYAEESAFHRKHSKLCASPHWREWYPVTTDIVAAINLLQFEKITLANWAGYKKRCERLAAFIEEENKASETVLSEDLEWLEWYEKESLAAQEFGAIQSI